VAQRVKTYTCFRIAGKNEEPMTTATAEQPAATVTRSTCERYDVRVRHRGWAVIMLSEAGGVLSIQSDYGTWGHCWPCHGRPSFKHFLVECDRDRGYLVRKFGGSRKDFDFAASVKNLRRAVGQAYRDRRTIYYASGRRELFDLAKCRELLAEVDAIEDTDSADDFARQAWSMPGGSVVEDYSDIIVKRDSAALVHFLERLWPAFIAELRRELATGAAEAPPAGEGAVTP
jgi:hypothetical protein